MARPLEYNATVVERVDLTDALSILLILPDRLPTRPWFAAGQYCVLIPHALPIREAVGVPFDVKDSLFFELYDPAPLIDISDPSVVQPLRARMLAALAKLQVLRD